MATCCSTFIPSRSELKRFPRNHERPSYALATQTLSMAAAREAPRRADGSATTCLTWWNLTTMAAVESRESRGWAGFGYVVGTRLRGSPNSQRNIATIGYATRGAG